MGRGEAAFTESEKFLKDGRGFLRVSLRKKITIANLIKLLNPLRMNFYKERRESFEIKIQFLSRRNTTQDITLSIDVLTDPDGVIRYVQGLGDSAINYDDLADWTINSFGIKGLSPEEIESIFDTF